MPAEVPPAQATIHALSLMLLTGLAATVTAGASGCGDDLPKPQLVTNLRIAAVRADPPEGFAGTQVELSALLLHPDANILVEQAWAACVVVPGQPSTTCTNAAAAGPPPPCATSPDAPICLVGMDPTVTYELPARAVSGVTAESGKTGEVVLTLVAGDQSAGGLGGCASALADPDVAPEGCRIAVKRLRVLPVGSSATPNQNPSLADLRRSGEALSVTVPSGAAEPTPAGPESLFLTWYTTGGELDKFRTDVDAQGLTNTFVMPTVPGSYRAAVVVRDGRGGEGWRTLDLTVP
jgi:hypothetical protein